LLLGRQTFDDFAGYWPGLAREAVPDGEPPDGPDALQRRYARRVDAMSKVVVSASGKVADWGEPQILSSVDEAEIRRLKEAPGSDIVMYGSLSVVGELTRLRLVDEYHLLVHPIFLGQGTPMFDQDSPVRLQLKSAEPLGSGVVLMKYLPREQS
jgi:dihydrofolate reductase